MKSAPLAAGERVRDALLALELDRRQHPRRRQAAEAEQLGQQRSEVDEHAAGDGAGISRGALVRKGRRQVGHA